MIAKLEKEYQEKVDACFGLEANPELRGEITKCLDDILHEFDKMEYDKEHYTAMYEKFAATVADLAEKGDIEELKRQCNIIFDAEYQKKLEDLNPALNYMCDIFANSSYDKIKDKAIGLYKIIFEAPELSPYMIDSYKETMEAFNNCLLEVDDFLTYELPYHVPYFKAYIQNMLDEVMDLALSIQLEQVKSKIEDFKDSPYNNDLQNLTVLLNRLEVIKESSDDYSINDKIDDLLKEISETSYLYSYTIKEFAQKAQSLIREYRYG